MSSPFHIPAAADPIYSMYIVVGFSLFFSFNGVLLWTNCPFPLGAESTSEQIHLLLSPSPLFKVTCCSSHKEHPQPEWLLHIVSQVPSIPFHSAKKFKCPLPSAALPSPRCPSSCSAGHSSVSKPWGCTASLG